MASALTQQRHPGIVEPVAARGTPRPFGRKLWRLPSPGSASRSGRDERRSSRTAARPEFARWPAPRTSRSVAAGSLAGTGGRCWRRAGAAC